MEEVTIRITDPNTGSIFESGADFKFWTDVEIIRSIDTFSTVAFNAPFEAERKELREVFRPFSFKGMEVFVGEECVFTGTLVDIKPEKTPESRTVNCSGYAFPAVMEDCTEPPDEVPTEFNKLGLRDIMLKLATAFNIGVDFRDPEGARFDKVELTPQDTPHGFLVKLAKQRNLVISNTPEGKLLCWKSIEVGSPVARFKDNERPLPAVSPTFSPQDYFSEMTGFVPAKGGKAGSKFTELNTFLRQTLRPRSFTVEDTDDADAEAAVQAKLGRMFGNAVAFAIGPIPSWRDPQGDLWKENTTVTLHAPDVMIYRETEFLVRSVKLNQDADTEVATLELVLPGAFSGELPTELPWEESPQS